MWHNRCLSINFDLNSRTSLNTVNARLAPRGSSFPSPLPSPALSGLSTNGAFHRTYSKTGKHSGLLRNKLFKTIVLFSKMLQR